MKYKITNNVNDADVILDNKNPIYPWEILVIVLYAILVDAKTIRIYLTNTVPKGKTRFYPIYISPNEPEEIYPDTKIPITSVQSFWRIYGHDVLTTLSIPQSVCASVADILEKKLIHGFETDTATEYAKDFSALVQMYLNDDDMPMACLTADNLFADLVRYIALGVSQKRLVEIYSALSLERYLSSRI